MEALTSKSSMLSKSGRCLFGVLPPRRSYYFRRCKFKSKCDSKKPFHISPGIRRYAGEMIDFLKHYNQPRIVKTRMKLTQKVETISLCLRLSV